MAGAQSKRPATVPVAGLYGNHLDAPVYRRVSPASGHVMVCIRCPNVDEAPNDCEPEQFDALHARLKKVLVNALVRYERSGSLTEIQIRTLRAVCVELESVSSFARREGVTRQAIRARIEGKRLRNGDHWGGILAKAPEFARAWPLIKEAQRMLGTDDDR